MKGKLQKMKIIKPENPMITKLIIAAEQGNATAQFDLGYFYDNGLGVEQDYKKAKECYEKAAEQGNATAQEYLGYIYIYMV